MVRLFSAVFKLVAIRFHVSLFISDAASKTTSATTSIEEAEVSQSGTKHVEADSANSVGTPSESSQSDESNKENEVKAK